MSAGTAALARLAAADEHALQVARHTALARGASALNESLDLDTVLTRICQEAASILDAEITSVYRLTGGDSIVSAAAFGMPPEFIGYELPLGAGLAGKVALSGRAMFTNDYQRIADLPDSAPTHVFRSAVAAPMRWDGELRGVLSVGWTNQRRVEADDLSLLEAFAELAAVACANATAAAGLALAARTDALTGCLNHAALHEGLGREIERATRNPGSVLSLVLIDLDDFKQVNELHGHLIGDEVLRRAGHALRTTTRPYDIAARYGGDEFALIAVEADEASAREIAGRALDCVSDAIVDLLPDGATAGTAGVAEWSQDVNSTELIARADRALLYAKQDGTRGAPMTFSSVPAHFRPGRFARHERHLPEPPPMPVDQAAAAQEVWQTNPLDERLRVRTKHLSLANALGSRLAAMTDVLEILDATVEELQQGFGYFSVIVVRLRDDDLVEAAARRGMMHDPRSDITSPHSRDEGLIGRCLRERRPVLSNDVNREPDYISGTRAEDVRSELVVPLWVGGELWGAINAEENRADAFGQDDLQLLQTVADQVGSAMRSAQLYERLERAYIGTAEALAAALEAKDAYTADHARTIAEQAETIGHMFDMTDAELRDLRFGAVFHDIGKIAIPEAILHKPGPLDPEERAVMERHTIVGEQILAPVEFLANVRRLVRHEHERWDGKGYPDGLSGSEIPLGSRIILACDALHAMTSDRPYRRAMPLEDALAELRRHAGSQFDPEVVSLLLDMIGKK